MTPVKQAAVQRAKNVVRSKKAKLEKARAAKLTKKLKKQQHQGQDNNKVDSDTVEADIPVRESASKRKPNFFEAAKQEQADIPSLSLVAIMDLSNVFLNWTDQLSIL